ncbi:MAG TPA: hypothetical protein IAA58_02775 [Candidatus Gallacutalibacter stercoravium]|nr:hypothetical protein [Candidatus Gallacutalibacter stercoravium]
MKQTQQPTGVNSMGSKVHITAVTQTPYMIEEKGVLQSETKLTLQNTGGLFAAWVRVAAPGTAPVVEPVGTIPEGESTVTVHVPELQQDGDVVKFGLYTAASCEGEPVAALALPQKKVRHWKVYVSHSSHVDFGYTDYQEYLRTVKWPSHLDEAFDFVEQTDSWPETLKFRHHIESSFLLYGSAMQVRDAAWIQKLKGYLQAGRIAYSASCMNTSMEAMSTEQLVRYYYYSARHLKDMLGVDSSGVAMMVDNPSISWANIDIMADAGIKYMYLGPNFNPNTPHTLTEMYPRLFYMTGRNPKNKVLILSGTLYNLDEMQFVYDGPNATPVALDTTVQCVSDALINRYQVDNYPYDAVVQMVDQYWDNGPLFAQVMQRVRQMSERKDAKGRPYVFPKFFNSNMKDFCQYIEEKYSGDIASYRGTIENWWCFGTPSDAYCAAQVREAHDLLPAAETLATLASSAVGKSYPYRAIANAYNHMMLYDEHTFGPSQPVVGDQHIWKRNTAVCAKRTAEELLAQAVDSLNAMIPAQGKTIVVHNPLSWQRGDVVRVALKELPEHFDIVEVASQRPVAYQKTDDAAVFYASNVPGLGYQCYCVRVRQDEPSFASSIQKTNNTLENRFYKITLDEKGEIAGIWDKRRNVQLADEEAPYRMNEFVYMTSDFHGNRVRAIGRMHDVSVSIRMGAKEGRVITEGFCDGTAGIRREIILYEDEPRIDFINTVYKNDALAWRKQDEEGFFVFPLRVPDFCLRHEMPVGDVRPYVEKSHVQPGEGTAEQFYTSSTDFYTANRWIDASSMAAGYGITLSALSAPIVQYGERRTLLYDLDYNTRKPWVYSYAINNKWGTNFMETQPGILTFRYSLQSHDGGDWRDGRADRFGWGISTPLAVSVISHSQPGAGFKAEADQWIRIAGDSVMLTTAKVAEANGEGVILRFNETLGRPTDAEVDLSFFSPCDAIETDLMENDRQPAVLKNGVLHFSIDGYGWKTFRIRFGEPPAQVCGVTAAVGGQGTCIQWNETDAAAPAFYEVFRAETPDFTAGTGSYLGSTCDTLFFDTQVTNQLPQKYFYRVRAVASGRKGEASQVVQAKAEPLYMPPVQTPDGLRADVAFGNRVSLSWSYPADAPWLQGFKLYRDGEELADLSAIHNSYLDYTVIPGGHYCYTVRAYDRDNTLSPQSNTVEVTTAKGWTKPGNIAPQAAVLASSQLNGQHPATAVADGFIGVTGEWASSGEKTPWIRLSWDKPYCVNRVTLYDRDTDEGHVRQGELLFSDGSKVEVPALPEDGSGCTIQFPHKNVDWITLQVTDGKGVNVGLAEIEVFVSSQPEEE